MRLLPPTKNPSPGTSASESRGSSDRRPRGLAEPRPRAWRHPQIGSRSRGLQLRLRVLRDLCLRPFLDEHPQHVLAELAGRPGLLDEVEADVVVVVRIQPFVL